MIQKLIKALFRIKTEAKPVASPRGVPTQVVRQHVISNPWHAVSIVPCSRACLAARQASAQRYLSADAPGLPLAICALPNCTCHYRHHQDRRASPRRAADVAVSRVNWSGRERRGASGRRITD